jgi:hypothetical protein
MVRRAAILLAAVACACGGGGEGGDPDAGGGGEADAGPWLLAGACVQNTRVGEAALVHDPNGASGSFTATITDTLVPNTVLTEREQDGPCGIWQRVNPFCDPPCTPGTETCSTDMTCIPAPRNQRAGTVTVTGAAAPISLEPNGANYYQVTSLPNPPFAPGERILLEASGDQIAAFSLRGVGIAPLELPEGESFVVRDGQPLDLAWDTTGTEDSTVYVELTVDQHGNSPVKLICEVPDTGSFSIPAGILGTFVGYGVTGFPNIKIVRRSADSITVAQGCIDLQVRSGSTEELVVEGHTPCVNDTQCPAPLTCDETIQTCI